MALLIWPSEIYVADSALDLRRAQASAESRYSLKRSDADYGGALWRGQVTLAFKGWAGTGFTEGDVIEAFLARLADVRNWVEVPVQRPAAGVAGGSTGYSGAALNTAGDLLTLSVSGATTGIAVGQLARIGFRTYRIATASGADLGLIPAVEPASGAGTIVGTDTVRAKMTPGSFSPPAKTPSLMGPWVLSWDEFVDTVP